jgi:hypothetical protein
MEQLYLPELIPFTRAMILVVLIGLIESVSILFAGVAGLTHLVGHVLDTDHLPDFPGVDWLFIKGMPLMVSLTAAASGFGVAGLLAQCITFQITSAYLPTAPAVAVGIVGMLGFTRVLSGFFARLNLSFSSTAVSRNDLAGCKAILLSPVARIGYPGQAQVWDKYGHSHYVMVEPDLEFQATEIIANQEFELVITDGRFLARPLK